MIKMFCYASCLFQHEVAELIFLHNAFGNVIYNNRVRTLVSLGFQF